MIDIMSAQNSEKGFTILELLIVAIVIAISVISLIAMLQNVTKRSRDATRLTDMANLYQAINSTIQNNADKERLYYILCSDVKTPCEGKSFPVLANTRKVDGSGWLKVQFKNKDIIRYNFLPLDPLNNSQYYYRYYSDGESWRLETKLESENFTKRMQEDGGKDPKKYEVFQNLKN